MRRLFASSARTCSGTARGRSTGCRACRLSSPVEPAHEARDVTIERGRELREEQRWLDELELHHHWLAIVTARHVDATIEDAIAIRLERGLGDRTLIGCDRMR